MNQVVFVRTYDQALPADVCDLIIDRFEHDRLHQQETDLKGHRHFTEINVTASDGWQDVHQMILNSVSECVYLYRTDLNLDSRLWPVKYGFEQIRIKRYEPNGLDAFHYHVDVGDYYSARRFLVCFFYLNTVEKGGETSFYLDPNHRWLTIKPERGRAVLFPPTWTFPHAGEKTLSGNKYIIGSYLHYL